MIIMRVAVRLKWLLFVFSKLSLHFVVMIIERVTIQYAPLAVLKYIEIQ